MVVMVMSGAKVTVASVTGWPAASVTRSEMGLRPVPSVESESSSTVRSPAGAVATLV